MIPEMKVEWSGKYMKSLADHLKYYREAARDLGVNEYLIEIHDDSKRNNEEWPWYVRRFGGGIMEPEFGAAWLHHIHHNPHHWEHWIMPGGYETHERIVRMPDEYILEMVADWMGSSKAYAGSYNMFDWLKKNIGNVRLHQESAVVLMNILQDKLGYKTYMSKHGDADGYVMWVEK